MLLGENNELPFVAEYDFIRFYKWDTDADYPVSRKPCVPSSEARTLDLGAVLAYR